MSSLGTLHVSLQARTKKFERGLKRARRHLKKFRNSIPGANLLLNKFTAALAVGGMAVFVQRSLVAGDALAKLSDRLRINVEELQGLRRAADLTGAGTATLDKGLEFLAKSLGEAKTGIGEAKQALGLLNIEVDDLLALDPAEQFKVLAEAVKNLTTQEEKAFVATKLFGRAGVALVNTLELGREGIQKSIDTLKEWGITVSRQDLAKIEAANDAWSDMGRVVDFVGLKLASELSPLIEEGAKQFVKWGAEGEGWGAKVSNGIRFVIQHGAKLIDVWTFVAGGLQMVGGISIGVFSKMGWLIAQVQQGAQSLVRVLTFGLADPEWGNKLEDQMEALDKKAQELKASAEKMMDDGFDGAASERALAKFDALKKKADALAKSVGDIANGNVKTAGAGGSPGGMSPAAASAEARRLTDREKAGAELAKQVEREMALRGRLEAMAPRARQFADDIFQIEKLRLAGLRELADRKEALLGKDMQALAVAEDLLRQEELAKKVADSILGGVKAAEDGAKKVKADHKKHEESLKRRAAAQKRIVQSVKDEIASTSARNAAELRAVENAQRRRDLIREIGEEMGNQLADQLEAAEVGKRQREEEEKAAEAAKRKADENERAARAKKKDLDITKRFAALPGTGGMFGFGARGFSSFGGGEAGKGTQSPAAGSSPGGAGMAPVKDIAPKIAQATAAFLKLRGFYVKIEKAITRHSTVVVSEVERQGKAAVRTVQLLANRESDLRARVRRIEQNLASAAGAGLGGQ